jgi:hypothetical protein
MALGAVPSTWEPTILDAMAEATAGFSRFSADATLLAPVALEADGEGRGGGGEEPE